MGRERACRALLAMRPYVSLLLVFLAQVDAEHLPSLDTSAHEPSTSGRHQWAAPAWVCKSSSDDSPSGHDCLVRAHGGGGDINIGDTVGQKVPSGYTCGSDSSRGAPSDWKAKGCSTPNQSMESFAKTCNANPNCKGFNVDTGDRNIPCWHTAAPSNPTNVGSFTGRWLQCKKTQSQGTSGPYQPTPAAGTPGAPSSAGTPRAPSTASTGCGTKFDETYPDVTNSCGPQLAVELNTTVPGSTKFVDCPKQVAPWSNCSRGKGPSYNQMYCPVIQGCATCPVGLFPTTFYLNHKPSDSEKNELKGRGLPLDFRVGKLQCTDMFTLKTRSTGISCYPRNWASKPPNEYDPNTNALSCIAGHVQSMWLTEPTPSRSKINGGKYTNWRIKCFVSKHVLCAKRDKDGKRPCASTKVVTLLEVQYRTGDADTPTARFFPSPGYKGQSRSCKSGVDRRRMRRRTNINCNDSQFQLKGGKGLPPQLAKLHKEGKLCLGAASTG